MENINRNGLEWLEFSLLQQQLAIVHGVFIRKNGMSSAPYDSLNVSIDVGDDPGNVQTNLDMIAKTMGVKRIITAKQCHGKDYAIVDENSPDIIPECDAFITKSLGLGIMIKHADCQAALIYDPEHSVIAAVHSGWKGNALNIYKVVITAMKEHFGSSPAALLVGISPSLSPDNFEFAGWKEKLPKKFVPYISQENMADFWSIGYDQCIAEGILTEHIEIARICTYGNENDFFSYRRDGVTGRNGTCIALIK